MLRRAGPCRADVCSLFLVSNASLSYCLCVCWENLGSMLLETRLVQQNLLLAVGGWLLRAKHALRGQDNFEESSKSLWYNATVSWHDVGVHPCNGITMPHQATFLCLYLLDTLIMSRLWLFQSIAAKPGQAEVYAGAMNKEAWTSQASRSGTHPSPRTIWNCLELTWTNAVITWTAPHAPRELQWTGTAMTCSAGQLWYKMAAFQISS